jgi:hypothetical protein
LRVVTLAVALFSLVANDNAACSEPFPDAEELLVSDRVFAKASAVLGADAWVEVWAEQGLLYRDGSAPSVGPQAVGISVRALVDELRRQPSSSAMLWPNELGYTIGNWWMRSDADGMRGRYLTVWHRVKDQWKIVLDLLLPRGPKSEALRDFDFWLGDWQLCQRIWSGAGDDFESYAARSQVRQIPGGGALVESFDGEARFFWLGMEGPKSMRGTSVRVYYPESGEWRIFWMDSLDPRFGLPFVGRFSGNVGEFLLIDRPGGTPPRKIRFESQPDGSVDWQLALQGRDEGWKPLWLINFRRPE